MPIHDWSRVDAGIFHVFHQRWIGTICDVLNEELLQDDYYALPEQWAGGRNPDVLTLRERTARGLPEHTNGRSHGTAIRERPKTTYVVESETAAYLRKKSNVVVRHVSDDRVMALIEIISPGNKSSGNAFKELKNKVIELQRADVNVMLIDLLPRTTRDPRGIHATIWESIAETRVTIPRKPPLTLVAYETGDVKRGYFEPVAVGQRLPDMPLFLEYGWHVPVPLEKTYTAAYRTVPLRWRKVIEGKER
jgi:Protein of unknown function (DUF4058)